MREIKLSQHGKNKGKYIALVDDEDYEYLNQWKWHACKRKYTFYAMRRIKTKIILMHRLIMETSEGMRVDHIDFNGLNCQKYNMRNCTHSQNLAHRNKIIGKSKYIGVTFVHDKYIMAQISINYKSIYLGYYNTEIEAAMAYDKKAKELYGEFATLNFK